MFGFACKDTESLMPAPIHYSHQILHKMAQARKDGSASGLEPDSKSQVTMMYNQDKPSQVTSVVISTQHSKDLSQEQVRELVVPYINKSIPKKYLEGLKENVIVGRLVPAGTGSVKVTWNKKASEDDNIYLAEQENKETLENQSTDQ